MPRNIAPNLTGVAICVGLYDTCVGLWPIVSMDSFTAITGLSSHLDVVRAIGTMWAGLGILLLVFCRKTNVVPMLGVASTLAGSLLALAECIFVATKVLSPIFLVQAACELTVGITWLKTFADLAGKRVPLDKEQTFNREKTAV